MFAPPGSQAVVLFAFREGVFKGISVVECV